MTQNTQSYIQTKIQLLIDTNNIPPSLKNKLKEIVEELPDYFENTTFKNSKDILDIVLKTTGYSGWNIVIYDFDKDKNAKKNYSEYIGSNEEDLPNKFFGKNCITYILSRESFFKNELCGLEIYVTGKQVNVAQLSLSGSGPCFSCDRKDFNKNMKEYFK